MSDIRKPHRDRVGVELAVAEMHMVAGRLHAMADEAEAGRNSVHIDVPGFRALADHVDKWARCVGQTCEIIRPATPDKFGVCSACGALVNMRDSVANATNYLKPCYCPNCRSRVVRRND